MMRGILKDATEKPSTKFLVSTGTRRPVRVVIRLADNPIPKASLGIFVDNIRDINGFNPVEFLSILENSFFYVDLFSLYLIVCHSQFEPYVMARLLEIVVQIVSTAVS
jgi:hypothetical protein